MMSFTLLSLALLVSPLNFEVGPGVENTAGGEGSGCVLSVACSSHLYVWVLLVLLTCPMGHPLMIR